MKKLKSMILAVSSTALLALSLAFLVPQLNVSALDNTDTDGDGIIDFYDHDDDNDGILDFNEECAGYIAQNKTGAWKGNTASNVTINYAPAISFVSGAWPVNTSQHKLHIDDGVGGAEQWGRSNKDFSVIVNFDTPVPASEIGFMVMDIDTLNSNQNSTWTIGVNGRQDTTGIFQKQEMDVTYATNDDDIVFSNGVISAPVAKDNQYALITGSDSTLVSSLKITGTNISGGSDMIGYSLFAYKSCDTDKDGLADKVDLDSDNDGCTDAVEGAGSFKPADLKDAQGSATSGPGSTAPNKNLGNTVNGDGVPTSAAPGQGVGTSQDATKKDADCCKLELDPDFGGGPENVALTFPSVLDNDKLNGAVPVIGSKPGEVTISQSGNWDTGVTLNTTTGEVEMSDGFGAGTYKFDYKVCVNGSVPQVCQTATVTINLEPDPVDDPPVIATHDKTIKQGEDLDLLTLVDSATDLEDGDVKDKVKIKDDGGFDKNVPGVYTITYEVTDSAGNTTTETAKVTVDAPPTLNTTDTEIVKGEPLDLETLATAKDPEDGDITNKIVITDNGGFENGVPGVYTITYEVTDSAGNKVTKTAQVKVKFSDVFDPPSARKTVSGDGNPEMEWKMVWINGGNAAALNTQVLDSVPAGTTYIADSVKCDARGTSTTAVCTYDAAENRVRWEGNIGPDLGGTNEADSDNEVVITFKTTVPADVDKVENQAEAYYDQDADGDFANDKANGLDPVLTDNSNATNTTVDPTVWTRPSDDPADPADPTKPADKQPTKKLPGANNLADTGISLGLVMGTGVVLILAGAGVIFKTRRQNT